MQYVLHLDPENVGQKSLIEVKDDDYDFNPGWMLVQFIVKVVRIIVCT